MKARVIKTDESVIYQGKIYTYDEELEIDDSVGKSLVERGYIAEIAADNIIPPTDEDTDGEDAEAEPEIEEGIEMKDISEMSYQELKSYASDLGLSAAGKKDELIARINQYFSECEEAETEDDGELPNTAMPE